MRNNSFANSSGASVVLFALAAPCLAMFAAIAVDVSTFYLQKRSLQAATDLAAIAAAENPSNPLAAAQANLVANGYAASSVLSVVAGTYTPDGTVPVGQRFTPGGLKNAVQVVSETQAPYYFANIMSMMSSNTSKCSNCSVNGSSSSGGYATITATATAAYDPRAAFAVASGLANLNGGILNSVLGGLLGSQVSLSAMDYQSLANANIDLFQFSNALASNANLTAVTYNQLANMQFSTPAVLSALAAAAGMNPNISSTVVSDINTLAALAPTNKTLSIAPLVSFGEYGALQVNSAEPITATADALDMVSTIAQIANGTHQVQVGLNLNAPPIASATLALTIGERPVGTSFVSIGSEGATAHTAQTRLLLTLQIAVTGSNSVVNLPLYIELASATAQLSALSCSVANPQNNSATLLVTPAVVDAWIGNVSMADMSNFSVEPYPGPATLLSVAGVATVTGRANVTMTNMSPTAVTFDYWDIKNDVRQTTSTQDFISSLLYNLFANLQLTVNAVGINLSLPSGLTSTVATTLSGATQPIDQTLNQVLQTLGLSLGNAYTWVSGVRCGSAQLVM